MHNIRGNSFQMRYGQSWVKSKGECDRYKTKSIDIMNITKLGYKLGRRNGISMLNHLEVAGADERFQLPGLRVVSHSNHCPLAFLSGYSKYTLDFTSFVVKVIPYWMCEIPYKLCEKDTMGDYVCFCEEGFEENSNFCKDIDECSRGKNNCHPSAICLNTNGSYKCVCKAGYLGNGTFCRPERSCLPIIPDNFLNLTVLGKDNCPTTPKSKCTLHECHKSSVSYLCHDGKWKRNNSQLILYPAANGETCDRNCNLDPTTKYCKPNIHRNLPISDRLQMFETLLEILRLNAVTCHKMDSRGKKCEMPDFHCQKSKNVIPLWKVCNQVRDCSDSSDETCGSVSAPSLKKVSEKNSVSFERVLSGVGGLFSFFGGLFGSLFDTATKGIQEVVKKAKPRLRRRGKQRKGRRRTRRDRKKDKDGDKDKDDDGDDEEDDDEEDEDDDDDECSWSSWMEIENKCSETCGKAERKEVLEKKFSFGKDCKKKTQKRKKNCDKDKPCLKCVQQNCVVPIQFSNFRQREMTIDLKQHLRSETKNDVIEFHIASDSKNFADNVTTCYIENKSSLKCSANKKGNSILRVVGKNKANEKLDIKCNVTVGDSAVRFVKNRILFKNFLTRGSVHISNLIKDDDIDDVPQFLRLELTQQKGTNLLPSSKNKIFKIFFQFDLFETGETKYTFTVESGGIQVSANVTLVVGKDVNCPVCQSTTVCEKNVLYRYQTLKKQPLRVKRALDDDDNGRPDKGKSKKRKRSPTVSIDEPQQTNSLIVGDCSSPYNSYFRNWLNYQGRRHEPYVLIQNSPYVFNGQDENGQKPYVKYITNNTNEETTANTQKEFRLITAQIFNKGSEELRSLVTKMVDELGKLRLIGYAVIYKATPSSGSAKWNIEFDHIPPKSAWTLQVSGSSSDSSTYGDNAPTISISNFDHRSSLWSKCSTGATKFLTLYKRFMISRNYACAIFANLKCLRDKEINGDVPSEERISKDKTAFIRYSDGFKGIVNLHFDYGANFNYAYMTDVDGRRRQFAKYCELRQPDFDDPAAFCNELKKQGSCETEIFGSQEYYYMLLDKTHECKVRERTPKRKRPKASFADLNTQRNMLRKERAMLIQWIGDSVTAGDDENELKRIDEELWGRCCGKGNCNQYLSKGKQSPAHNEKPMVETMIDESTGDDDNDDSDNGGSADNGNDSNSKDDMIDGSSTGDGNGDDDSGDGN